MRTFAKTACAFALASLVAGSLQAVPMASQQWTTNRIGEAVEGIYSNVYTRAETEEKIVELAPAPGNYAVVSNKAMTAVQSLEPATNYTDEVAFRAADDATNYTDAVAQGKADKSDVYTKQETDDRIVELAPAPGNYGEVSNKAMTAIQSLQPSYDYTDHSISTGNAAFVSAVVNCPVSVAPEDGQALGEFGTYGTLGALLAALAAAVTWLVNNKADKSEMSVTDGTGDDSDKTTIQLKSGTSATVLTKHQSLSGYAKGTDLPYAMVTLPANWTFSGNSYDSSKTYTIEITEVDEGAYEFDLYIDGVYKESNLDITEHPSSVEFPVQEIVASYSELPALSDRANNLVDATAGNLTLTLPAYEEGKVRDLLVHVNVGPVADNNELCTVTVNFPTGESNTGFKVKGNASSLLPAPDAAGEWLYSFSECEPHKMAVSLAQLQDATTGGS